jgi:hypothetical protein
MRPRITEKHGRYYVDCNRILHTYIRDKRGRKLGVAVAIPVEGEIYYGFSKLNLTRKTCETCGHVEQDKFRPELMMEMAVGRALFSKMPLEYPFAKWPDSTDAVPKVARQGLLQLYDDVQIYLKNHTQ